MKCVPEGFAGLPVPSAAPVIRQRRDPEGSRLSLRAVAAPSALKRLRRKVGTRKSALEGQSLRAGPNAGIQTSVPEPQLRNNGRCVTRGVQFFHQPLTVSMACVPRSDSAEWALTRPEDRRAAWKREATFSQFTRFHQALT